MNNRDLHQQQHPVFDLNTLDDQHEIRMDYDQDGNLVRIRKVRRTDGCALVFAALFLLGILAYLALNP